MSKNSAFLLIVTSIIIISCDKKYKIEPNQSTTNVSSTNGGPQKDEVLYDPKTDTSETDTSENPFSGGEGNMYNESSSSKTTVITGRTSTYNSTQSINKTDEPTMSKVAASLHPRKEPTNDFDRQMHEFDHGMQQQQEQKKQRSLYDKMTYEEAEPLHYMDADKVKH